MTLKKSANYHFLAFVIITLYLSPFLILGQDIYIPIKDLLDSTFVHFKTLAESGQIFSPSSSVIEEIMNSSRISFFTEFRFILWLFYFFDPLTAYIINQFLIRVIAYLGMYLLLNKYIFENNYKSYTFSIAILYALLPFYSLVGISVAGLPYITYVFLNIRNKFDSKKDWFSLILFPFYTSIIVSTIFYISLIVLVWFYDLLTKNVSKNFTLALLIFTLVVFLRDYRLFDQFFFEKDFISHRIELKNQSYDIYHAIAVTTNNFIYGHVRAASLHTFFLPLILIVFTINIFSQPRNKLFLILFFMVSLFSILLGFAGLEIMKPLNNFVQLKGSFNYKRYYFISPFIWFLLFAVSIKYILTKYNFDFFKKTIWILKILTLVLILYNNEALIEYKRNGITYKQFFAEKLFNKIKKFIGKDQDSYKVGSIGLHPSIARYNGFYTLDGYLGNYDLDYKHLFRKIISQELEKNEELKKSFDEWGNRAYIYIAEIGTDVENNRILKNKRNSINVNLNTSVLYNMGGQYLISSYKIENFLENNLLYLKKFTDRDSAWEIFLYKVNN